MTEELFAKTQQRVHDVKRVMDAIEGTKKLIAMMEREGTFPYLSIYRDGAGALVDRSDGEFVVLRAVAKCVLKMRLIRLELELAEM